jgi:putative Mn2+ efflux pump MntP
VRAAEILALSVGVAMDATAAAAACGLAAPRFRARDAALVGGLFGLFQGLMPLLGWLLGHLLGPVVERWDHWIAFVVLAGLGLKTCLDARKPGDPAPTGGLPGWRTLVALAIATSIDAFAVGVTLPLMGAPMALSVITIGVTTALLGGAGYAAGRRFGAALGKRVQVVGGLVLIAMGANILIQHLRA